MQGKPTRKLTDDELEEDEDDDDNEQVEDFRTRLWTQNHVQCFGVPIHENIIMFFQLALLFVTLLLFGGGIFHLIEHPHEENNLNQTREDFNFHREQIIEKLHNHTATGDMLDTIDFYELLREHYIGFNPEQEYDNKWKFTNSIIFSFTIITTIGYGNFVPQTQWGQIFLMLYGLIGIPIAGISLGFIAQCVLYGFTMFSQLGKDKAAAAFNEFDADGSGELDEEEFFAALERLGVELSDEENRKLWREVDTDGGGEIDLEEFRTAVKTLNADLTEAAGKKNEVIITLCGILFWFLFGVLVFKFSEKWDYIHAIYFLFVSLTTIGLGDVVPETVFGEFFLIIFAMIGLGLVAVLITLIRDLLREQQRKRKIRVRAQKELKQKRKALENMNFFSSMTRDQIENLIEKMEIVSFFPHSQIIREGNLIESYYVLWNGSVNITSADGTINEKIESPSLLMESAIMNDSRSPTAYASVHAYDTVEILSFRPDDYQSSITMSEEEEEVDDDKSIEIGIITSSGMGDQREHFHDSFDYLPETEQLTISFQT